eukprot:6476558-Amphidinium_carterae.2
MAVLNSSSVSAYLAGLMRVFEVVGSFAASRPVAQAWHYFLRSLGLRSYYNAASRQTAVVVCDPATPCGSEVKQNENQQ